MAKAAAIYLTELDLTRLENAANRAGSNSPLAGLVDDLIARANVVPGNKIPADVVTMNSVVCVVDDTGAEQEWTLVYPEEANVASASRSNTPRPMVLSVRCASIAWRSSRRPPASTRCKPAASYRERLYPTRNCEPSLWL